MGVHLTPVDDPQYPYLECEPAITNPGVGRGANDREAGVGDLSHTRTGRAVYRPGLLGGHFNRAGRGTRQPPMIRHFGQAAIVGLHETVLAR